VSEVTRDLYSDHLLQPPENDSEKSGKYYHYFMKLRSYKTW